MPRPSPAKDEHKQDPPASQGRRAAGSVYGMVLDDGADFAGIGDLMAAATKYRGCAGAVIDASIRDTRPDLIHFESSSRAVNCDG